MLKYVLLGTAMCIATPALAQETATPDTQTEPVAPVTDPVVTEESTTPADPAPAVTPAPTDTIAAPQPLQSESAVPAPAAPNQPVAEAPTAAPSPEVAATPAPAGRTASTPNEIATVVNAEFGNYDKNGDGVLDQTEFAAWIGVLRKASEPNFAADSNEGKAWLAAAFTAADADKNAGVNATELTSFLTPKPAA